MKKIRILQLIASICLLLGSSMNILNLFIDRSPSLYACTALLLGASAILFGIVLVNMLKAKPKDGNAESKNAASDKSEDK